MVRTAPRKHLVAILQTSPIPSSTVDLSSDRLTCFMRAKEMCTPVVLDWPGFEA